MKKNKLLIVWVNLLLLLPIFLGAEPTIVEQLTIDQVPGGFPVDFSLVTAGNTQYTAYFNSSHQMVVAKRSIGSTLWSKTILPETIGWDSHNYVTLQIDSENYIHVSGNMHNNSLRYYRSTSPNSINSFEQLNRMIGQNESSVTYPSFLKGTDGALYFYYRDGGSGDGVWYFNRYDVASRRWSRLYNQPLFGNTGSVNAYFTGPTLGPDGRFHIAFLWRDTPDADTCHDMSYIRTRDSSLGSWETITGQALTLPVTVNNTNTRIDSVAAYDGLINMGYNIGFDSQERPIITYHKYDSNGNSQIYNASHENNTWTIHQSSSWNYRWEFGGFGAIPCDVWGGPITLTDGILLQDFYHIAFGTGHWELNPENLQPTAVHSSPFGWPEELNRVTHSNLPNGQVNWHKDAGLVSRNEQSYFLRWETMPPNNDLEPSFIPTDSALTLLLIDYTGTAETLPPTPSPSPLPLEAYPLIHSVSSQPEANHQAINLLDGNLDNESRWSAQGYPQNIVIDYGIARNFTAFNIYTYESRAYQYTIELSDSPDSGYKTVVNRSSNTTSVSPIIDNFSPQTGRYVRLTIHGASGYNGDWVSLIEIKAQYTSIEPTPLWPKGDVDHDSKVNIIDALLIAQYYVKLEPYPFFPDQGDVDNNGLINIVDALLIASFYVGLIDHL